MRLDPYREDPAAYGHLRSLHGHLAAGRLAAPLREMIAVRVSQVNGCGFCLALHLLLARRAGVDQPKLDLLPGWRESSCYDDRERAALALAEAMVRVGDGRRVEAEIWDAAAARFDAGELAELVYAVALVDAFNRINVAVELPADLDRFFSATG